MDSKEINTPFKILVITSPKAIRNIQKKVLREENISITRARLNDISTILDSNGPKVFCKGKSLKEFDFVWIQSAGLTKDIAYMLSLHLDELKIPHTNPEMEITKLVDLFSLSLSNSPIPKTYYCAKSKLILRLPFISKELGYPFIIKATVGWGGSDVHIINNAADFFALVPDLPDHKKYTCQKFIPNKFDYRVIVGNGIVLSGEMRVRKGDIFRNNASLGAEEVFLDIKEIPKAVKDIAIKVAAVCKLSWAGVDVVTSEKTGKHYVLEVNRHPGITKKSTETAAAVTFLKGIKSQVLEK